MSISMDKQNKITSQNFDFLNFVTETCFKHIKRFSRNAKLSEMRNDENWPYSGPY